MNLKEEQEEIRKEFQLERVILFSDAVFAIIITIMVIDIKLPENIKEATDAQLTHAFKELIFRVMTYALSFFLVARFWMTHLKIFSFLKDYDKNVLMLNLGFLFTVSLFPFGVSMISGRLNPSHANYAIAIYIYVGVVFASIITQAIMTGYLMRHKQRLCLRGDDMDQALKWKAVRANFVTIPIVLAMFITLRLLDVEPMYAFGALGLYGIATKIIFKRYYPDEVRNTTPLLMLFRKRTKAIASAPKHDEEASE